MTRLLSGAAVMLVLAALPAAADEFTDTLASALKAYNEGDVSGAREDLDYAGKLLGAMKSDALAKFLPEAPPGWIREATPSDDASAAGGFMGMFGGGTTASATYRKDAKTFTIALVADSPMVNGLGAMISGVAGLAGGKPIRIQRVQFTQSDDGLQGVVNNKVMINVSGDASIEDKTAALETMDFKALGGF
jgi:hypothetical protein